MRPRQDRLSSRPPGSRVSSGSDALADETSGHAERRKLSALRPELERVELRVAQPENEEHQLSGERAQVGAPAPRDGPGQVVAQERVAVGGGEARQRSPARVGELHAHVAGRGSLDVQLEAAAGELDERSGQAAAAVVGIGRNEAVEALDGQKDRAHAAQALEAGVLAVEVVVAGGIPAFTGGFTRS